jgi:large subunit ribosomal protein L30
MPRTFVWHPSRGPAKTPSFKFKDGDKIRIKQVRSGIGHEARMRRTLEAIGIKHHQATIERELTPALRGQIKQVRHLLEVTAAEESEQNAKRSASNKTSSGTPKASSKAAKKTAAKEK